MLRRGSDGVGNYLVSKIAIIGCKGIPASYGGFETLAENLVRHLSKQFEFVVYCSSPAYEKQPSSYLGAELKYVPFDANGVQSIPYDIWSMVDASRKADVLLILGVSGCIFLPLLKLFCKGRILVNLDGMDWKRPKWGRLARAFLKFSEAIAARFADGLVSDNEAIYDYICDEYDKTSFLVEYGGDNARPALASSKNSDLSVIAMHKHGEDENLIDTGFDDYAVAVCRIEPENNVHMTLEAFASGNNKPLVFIGNWDYSEYGRELRARYADNPNLLLLDPVFEPRRLYALRNNASLYIHGHSSGGTNPSLVESMSLGLPVIAFDVVFNRATTEDKAAYFDSAESLNRLLASLSDAELQTNAARMRELAERRYSWKVITSKYASLFGGRPVQLSDDTPAAKVIETGTANHAQPEAVSREADIESAHNLSRTGSNQTI